MNAFDEDLTAALQELPETEPVEIDGIQLSGTCAGICIHALTISTICIFVTCN